MNPVCITMKDQRRQCTLFTLPYSGGHENLAETFAQKSTAPSLSNFVKNRAILQTSKANLSQSGCNMDNLFQWWSHYCRDTVYRFAWILDRICRSSVKKIGLAKTCLMVALRETYVRNVGQRFRIAIQGVCVQSLTAIGLTVSEISW